MEACRFSLLGVPVRLRAPTPALRDRLRICYGALVDHPHDAKDGVVGEIESAGSGFAVRVTGRDVVTADDPTDAVRALNHQLVHGLMLRRDDLFVHAGVVAVDGAAIVLPGLSRAGKSTLVLALVLAGAAFLSDELLVFDPATRTLLPFARALKIRDECTGYFPALHDAFVGRGEGRFLPWAAIPEIEHAGSARLRLVAAPRWDASADSTCTPMTTGEGLLQLASSALNFGTHRHRSIDHLGELCAETEGVRIAWSDPHAAARALLDSLRRVTSPLHS